MKSLIATLLFFALPLFSHFEHDPLVFYGEHLNTMTGDYQISRVDHTVDAIEPISITRTYESCDGEWRFLPQTHLFAIQERKRRGGILYTRIVAYEPNGSRLTYTLQGNQFLLDLPKGYANSAREPLSARTLLANQTLDWVDDTTIVITTPMHTKRIYRLHRQNGRQLTFQLMEEQRENGHLVLYQYDQEGRLQSIRTTNEERTRTYALCSFVYSDPTEKGYNLRIESSDSVDLYYYFSLLERSKVRGNTYALALAPQESFQYEYLGRALGHRLTKHSGTSIEYDTNGRVIKIGDHTEVSYDDAITEITDLRGQMWRYFFSSSSQLSRVEMGFRTLTREFSDTGMLLARNRQRYCYDQQGNLIDPDGKERVYDELGRLIQEVGTTTKSYVYKGASNLLEEIAISADDRVWVRTLYHYDEDQQLLSKTLLDQEGSCSYSIELEGPAHAPTAIVEKSCGVEIHREPITNGLNPLASLDLVDKFLHYEDPPLHENAIVTRDPIGRVLRQEVLDEKGSSLFLESFEYDAFHLISHTNASGLTTRYHYDNRGNRTEEILELGGDELVTLYTYDERGRIATMQKGELLTRSFYDEGGHLTTLQEETLDGEILTRKVPEPPKASPHTLPSFENRPGVYPTYDRLGRLVELTTADGSVHYTLTYNKSGQVVQLTDQVTGKKGTRTFDLLGNLVEETLLNGQTLTSEFDKGGRRLHLHLPDDSYIEYRWSERFLTEIYRVTDHDRFKYRHLFLDYNLQGFPLKQRLIEGFGECSYEMDETGTLTSVQSRHFSEHLEQITTVEITPDPKHYECKCDGLGRVIEFQIGMMRIYYTYDIWDRRMSKRVLTFEDGAWKETLFVDFLYDQNLEIGTIDVEEKWLRTLRICAPCPINPGDQAIAYELSGRPYAPLYDLKGNVKLLLSVIRHKMMESYTFSPSGSATIIDNWLDPISESKAGNPWRFRSAPLDQETGLYYFQGTYYDPERAAPVPPFATIPEELTH